MSLNVVHIRQSADCEVIVILLPYLASVFEMLSYSLVRYTREGRADKLLDCQTKMSELDRAKVALESQKSELVVTVDEIRQDLAAQKVCICICTVYTLYYI